MKLIAKIFAGLLGCVVVLAAALTAAVFILDWNKFRGEVAGVASEWMGRTVALDGLDVQPGWTTTVTLEGLSIENPRWAVREHLFEAETVRVAIRTWPLILGDVQIPSATFVNPRAGLQRDADGRETWRIESLLSDAATPEDRTEFPLVASLEVEGGNIDFRDDNTGYMATLAIDSASGEATDFIMFRLDGALSERPLTVTVDGGSLDRMQDPAVPYPLKIDMALGDTRLAGEGTLNRPLQLSGGDMRFTFAGPNLANLFPIIPAPLPETPPYKLSGMLRHKDARWTLEDFAGNVGDSDMAGTVTMDLRGAKPLLTGDVVSERLDLDDLAGLIGAAPDASETANSEQKAQARAEESDGSIFPDEPIATDALMLADVDLKFEARAITAETTPIRSLATHVQLTDGRVLLRPFEAGIAGGRVQGEIALNARTEVPSADADLQFERLDLKPFFRGTEFVQEVGGNVEGQIYVIGSGRTIAELASTARGSGWLATKGGSISGLIVEGIGLDVVEALALFVGDDAMVPIRCGLVEFDAEGGTLFARRAIVDTSDSVVLARGSANLRDELLNMQVEARPKDFSLIDLATPIAISGSFEDPEISLGGLDPLPFFELGQAEDVNCGRLLASASAPTPKPNPEQ